MRVFKPNCRQRDGTMTRTRKWYLEFRDHIGIVRRLAGYDDKRMTEKLAEYVQELVNCRAVGVSPDVKVGQWLESVSVHILAKLVEWGLVDGERAETTKPLADHIDDYSRVLGNRQRSRDYAVRVPNRLRKIVQACRFVYLRDVTRTKVEAHLRKLKTDGMKDTTVGHYADAITSFLNWAKQDGRIVTDPLAGLVKPQRDSEDKGVLTPDQFMHLLDETSRKNILIGHSSGRARAVLYLLAGVTGLRRKELLLLTWANIHLDLDGNSFVRVPAKLTKNGKEANQPIAGSTVTILRAYKAAQAPNDADRVFGCLSQWVNTADLIRHDLTAAGLPPVDREGNEICFHSLRNSYISYLANSTTPPKVVQKLARHSDPKLTFNTYARVFQEKEQEAVRQLPNVTDFAAQFCLPSEGDAEHTLADFGEQKTAVLSPQGPFQPIKKYPQGESNPCLQDENLIS